MKVIKFSDPLYQASICYLVGGTVSDMLKYLKKVHDSNCKYYSWGDEHVWEDDAEDTDGYQFHVNAPLGDGEIFYVWASKPTPSIIFHETFHLVGDILYTRGFKYSSDSEEGYAYLGGWIFDKVYKSIKIVKDSTY